MIDNFDQGRTARELFFICDEAVPSFGAMQVTGATATSEGNIVLTTSKWSSGSQIARVVFNGPYPVRANEQGSCTSRYPCQARLHDPEDAFSLTGKLGLVSGSFDLTPDTGDKLLVAVCLDESKAYYVDDQNRSVWIMPITSDVAASRIAIVKITYAVTARSGTTPGAGIGYVQTTTLPVSPGILADLIPGTALNLSNSYSVSVPVDEYAVAVKDNTDEIWWVIPPPGTGSGTTSKRIRGTIKNTGSMAPIYNAATGAGPFTLENIEGIDAIWAGAAEVTITNPEGWKLWSDEVCTARCEYNETSGDWEVYSAQADRIVYSIAIKPEECSFIYLTGGEGWRYWKGNELGGNKDADWVTSVDMLGCDLTYSKCSERDVSVKTFDYVTFVEFDLGTSSLNVDYCNLTSTSDELPFVTDVVLSSDACTLTVSTATTEVVYDMPYLLEVFQLGCQLFYVNCLYPTGEAFADVNFIDRIIWNQSTCKIDYEFCDGTTSFVDFPAFVTNVELSTTGCKLEVTRCGDPYATEITMPYLVSVEVVGSYLQSETACGDTFNIIEFTTCP